MKKIYVFLGPPGSGKGTQAQSLRQSMDCVVVSTGDLLREEIKRETVLGKKIQTVVESGGLVPDELLIAIIEPLVSGLSQEPGAVIFDGFPRTVGQAKQFDQLLSTLGRSIEQVLYFDASLELVLERISGRRICSYCSHTYHVVHVPPKQTNVCDECGHSLIVRDDDQANVVRKRYQAYCDQTAILRSYYEDRCAVIDTSQSLKVITRAVLDTFGCGNRC